MSKGDKMIEVVVTLLVISSIVGVATAGIADAASNFSGAALILWGLLGFFIALMVFYYIWGRAKSMR